MSAQPSSQPQGTYSAAINKAVTELMAINTDGENTGSSTQQKPPAQDNFEAYWAAADAVEMQTVRLTPPSANDPAAMYPNISAPTSAAPAADDVIILDDPPNGAPGPGYAGIGLGGAAPMTDYEPPQGGYTTRGRRGTAAGRGRGRGRGRGGRTMGRGRGIDGTGVPPEFIGLPEDGKWPPGPEDQQPKRSKSLLMQFIKAERPWFIVAVTIVDVALLLWSIGVNGGVEPWSENPWFGPSIMTLLKVGGKYAPYIRDRGEGYRFLSAVFLHVGIIHLVLNLMMQLRVGLGLERSYGAYRIGAIYLLCGVFGNLISAIFLPATVTVGASGSLFGFLGVLLADLIQNWSLLQSPVKNLISLLITIIISLAIGLLPGIDNFAHVGGFCMGILTGVIFLPNLNFGKKCHARCRCLCTLITIPATVALFIIMFIVFYEAVDPNGWCYNCQIIDCIPVYNWCDTGTG